jgi:hypothetical protein
MRLDPGVSRWKIKKIGAKRKDCGKVRRRDFLKTIGFDVNIF